MVFLSGVMNHPTWGEVIRWIWVSPSHVRQPGADRSGSDFQPPQPKLTGFTGQRVTGPPAIGQVVTGQHKSSHAIESSDVDMPDVQLDGTASLQAQLRSVQAQLQ